MKPFIRRTGALTRAFERNHLPSAGRGHQEGGEGGGGSGGGGGGGRGGNGLSSRRRSGSDVLAAGAEEAPRWEGERAGYGDCSWSFENYRSVWFAVSVNQK